MKDNWLPLVDYSNKYRISISTLRRRIKLESIQFKLAGGKYYIVDESPDDQGALTNQKSIPSRVERSGFDRDVRSAPPKATGSEKKNFSDESPTRQDAMTTYHEPVFSAANRLLDELKKAYTLILQEKDEQIRNLREEISDLKTLVRVLEGENARLGQRLGEPLSD